MNESSVSSIPPCPDREVKQGSPSPVVSARSQPLPHAARAGAELRHRAPRSAGAVAPGPGCEDVARCPGAEDRTGCSEVNRR